MLKKLFFLGFVFFHTLIFAASTVTVTVTNNSLPPNNTIEGATVTLTPTSGGKAVTGTTDQNGVCIFSSVDTGEYNISAFATNYSTATLAKQSIDGTNPYNFTIQLTPVVITNTLTVITQNVFTERPLQNVSVTIFQNGTQVAQKTSNSQGQSEFLLDSYLTYTIRADLTNYDTAFGSIALNNDSTLTLDMTPLNTGLLSGNVRDVFNNNLQNIIITVISNNSVFASTTTDFQGYYQISGLEPGSYILRASTPDYQIGIQGVVLVDDQDTTANFALQPNPASLSGIVTDGTNPLGEATINVFFNNILISQQKSEPTSGYYISKGLSSGGYSISANKANYQTIVVSKTLNAITNQQNFSLSSQSTFILSGGVVDSLSNPINDAVVVLCSNGLPLFSVKTDSNGAYAIQNVSAGDYTVYCQKNGYLKAIREVTISSTKKEDFTLSTGGSILNGYITSNLDNSALVGAFLNLYYEGMFIGTAVTNAQGLYAFTGLPAGNYQIIVTCKGFSPQESTFNIGNSDTLQINFQFGSLSSTNPTNGRAILSLNRFALQTQRVYTLSWDKPSSSLVAGYILYRNTQKIATLPSPNMVQYVDKTPPNSIFPAYEIVSVDAANQPIGVLNVYP